MDDPFAPETLVYDRFSMIGLAFLALFCLTNLIMGFTGAFFCLRRGHHVPRGLRNASKVGAFLPPIGLIFGSFCISMHTH